MKPETKKKVIIISSVFVIGGILVYVFRKQLGIVKEKQSPTKSDENTNSGDSTGASTTQPPKSVIEKPGASASAPVIAVGKEVYSTGNGVNLRAQPSITGQVIGKFNKGQKVGYTYPGSTSEWIAVRSPLRPSITTYINKQYAEIK